MVNILNAKFIISAEKLSQCPETELPEFALVGRSNVGKSSFINTLTNNSKLAKTSNTPGKTRLINFFNFSDKFMITDLPGYGYAKISKSAQEAWQRNLENYLKNRKQIKCVIQLIDARHDVQKNDLQMRAWLDAQGIRAITVVTKIDCVPRRDITKIVNNVKKYLMMTFCLLVQRTDIIVNLRSIIY
ncbi:YihA family ribosome biogenesis GTP-binding protein [bacterium]|nr:YihA family ribosome biogenesis GTP-binding protein [bacterium]